MIELSNTSSNSVFVVRYAHPNAHLRSHFTNTGNVNNRLDLSEIFIIFLIKMYRVMKITDILSIKINGIIENLRNIYVPKSSNTPIRFTKINFKNKVT